MGRGSSRCSWLAAAVCVAACAGAADLALPAISVLGLRGAQLVAYDVPGAYFTRLGGLPFPYVQGVEWSADGRRWAAWGSAARERDWSSDLVRHGPRAAQSLVIGGTSEAPCVVPLQRLNAGEWQAEEVLLARWNRSGTALFLACRPVAVNTGRAPASTGRTSLCAVIDAHGNVRAVSPTSEPIRSAAAAPDDRTWILVPDGEAGTRVLRWQAPGAPAPETWGLPSSEPGRRVVGIEEIVWHPTDVTRLAVLYRLAPGDSSWVVATIRDDGSAAAVAVRPRDEIRELRWSTDGERLYWIAPINRSYRYRGHELAIRYDVLWSALPSYEPRVEFDIVQHIELFAPEELTALASEPSIDSYALAGDGLVVAGRYAGAALLPMKRLWWITGGRPPVVLFDDASWRGPIGIRGE